MSTAIRTDRSGERPARHPARRRRWGRRGTAEPGDVTAPGAELVSPGGSSPEGPPAAGPAAHRRRRWPWLLAMGLALALLGAAVYGVFATPLLGVRAVTVTGAPDPLAAQVRAAVDIADGTPLARVDLDAVAAAVDGVPEVASAEVGRQWPDTVAISVTPRVPVAVTAANGTLWLLDATGDPYLAVDAAPAGLPTLELVSPSAGDPSTLAALQVISALTPEFRAQLTGVSARAPYDIRLRLTDDRTVVWGGVEQSAQKMQILPAVLARAGTDYNISDPDLVTVR